MKLIDGTPFKSPYHCPYRWHETVTDVTFGGQDYIGHCKKLHGAYCRDHTTFPDYCPFEDLPEPEKPKTTETMVWVTMTPPIIKITVKNYWDCPFLYEDYMCSLEEDGTSCTRLERDCPLCRTSFVILKDTGVKE